MIKNRHYVQNCKKNDRQTRRKKFDATGDPAKITVVTAVDPPRVGKIVRPDGKGGYTNNLVMNYSTATYRTEAVPSLDDLAALVSSCRPGLDYLVAGVAGGSGSICGYEGGPGIQKTNANFPFPIGPGLLLVDMDDDFALEPKEISWAFMEAGLWNMVEAGFVWYPTSSSFLQDGERQLSGLRGAHAAFLVKDASDIPRAGTALFIHFYLAGYGKVRLSSAGAKLVRSAYDEALLRPMQPIFSGGACCEDGIEQRRGDPIVVEGVEMIDTRNAIPDPDPETVRSFNARVTRDKQKVEAEAVPLRIAHAKKLKRTTVSNELAQILLRSPTEVEITERVQIREKRGDFDGIEKALAGKLQCLPLGFPIKLVDGELRTVEEILFAGDEYHRVVCYDPMNPENLSAMIFTDGVPNIHSEAGLKPTWQLGTAKDRRELANHKLQAIGVVKRLRNAPKEVLSFLAERATSMCPPPWDALTDDEIIWAAREIDADLATLPARLREAITRELLLKQGDGL